MINEVPKLGGWKIENSSGLLQVHRLLYVKIKLENAENGRMEKNTMASKKQRHSIKQLTNFYKKQCINQITSFCAGGFVN